MKNIEEIKAKVNRLKRDSKTSRLAKFYSKMEKNRIKYNVKKIKDFDELSSQIGTIKSNDNWYIFSNKFDSPNLLLYLDSIFKISECYISTWAITDRGLFALKTLNDKGVKSHLLLDKTYSYKWVFTSGAIDYLRNVDFKFTENHSKMILIKTECGLNISIIGSMNMSNNPRYENINIVENQNIYNFFKNQIKQFHDGEVNRQGILF